MPALSCHSNSETASSLYEQLSLPVDRKCIRLLDIITQDPQINGGLIQATMRVAELDSDPSFAALSYVWSQRSLVYSGPTAIICNGIPIPITANCYLAILHLQRKLRTFTVWIDAVSINQDDEKEKSHQIPLMDDIYSCAQTVYVWLCEGNEATDRAMSYLGTAGLLEYCFVDGDSDGAMLPNPRVWAGAWFAFAAYFIPSRHLFPLLRKEPNLSWHFPFLRRFTRASTWISHYDLNELLTREWITRIWTYQEIMLARNPVIVCGDAHLPWSRFALSILFLNHVKPKRLANLDIPLNTTFWVWKKIIQTRFRLRNQENLSVAKKECRILQLASSSSKRSKEPKLVNSSDTFEYREFLYRVFFLCLMFHQAVVVLACVSGANLLASIIVTTYIHNTPSRASTSVGLYVYTSISCVIFLVTFSGYSIMVYSYFHKTLYNMPSRRQWLHSISEDTDDDLIDAIITRKARDPKDMAFGLQSVLSMKLGRDLPPPNYATSLGQTYKEFTINLLHTTDHLQFLLPAAGNRIPGQPSWIPNWSTEFPSYWLQPFMTRQSSIYSHLTRDDASKTGEHLESQQRKLWQLDLQTSNNLTVLGHHFCTVTKCFELQLTQGQYNESEKAIHIENIRVMQNVCANSNHNVQMDFFANRLNFPGLPADTNPNHLRMYCIFIWTCQKLSPEHVLRFLTTKNTRTTYPLPYGFELPLYLTMSGHQLLGFHIAICNDIVRTKRKVFSTKNLRRGTDDLLGVALFEAKEGDRVILVPRLPSLLIVRERDDGTHSLVSPAVILDYVGKEIDKRVRDKKKKSVGEILEPFTLS